jgi:osmotically inducible lipoprotein OsmB
MNTLQRRSISAVALALLLTVGGCANMSEKDTDTALGAGAGGVAGAVVTGGSPIGIVGGAAVGGLIGRVIGDEVDDKKD